jgi:hypothetical protein
MEGVSHRLNAKDAQSNFQEAEMDARQGWQMSLLSSVTLDKASHFKLLFEVLTSALSSLVPA